MPLPRARFATCDGRVLTHGVCNGLFRRWTKLTDDEAPWTGEALVALEAAGWSAWRIERDAEIARLAAQQVI